MRVGIMAPGGCIYRTDPDGKDWELVSMGYRNPYDIAFNRDGELFTYDSDMEWDMNTPWYRPTRVCHAHQRQRVRLSQRHRQVAGLLSRQPAAGGQRRPRLAPRASTFGYGAKFPAKYQEALFLCDWSYGKLYALHLKPDGASYTGELEEFLTGTPLPLTDIVINPKDGRCTSPSAGGRTSRACIA